jgi:RHH-type proline utilization regulon transcriptional repressor/proline dehydrogenase/delta 1-pyrroline-5-carboxylate dehydrogenase
LLAAAHECHLPAADLDELEQALRNDAFVWEAQFAHPTDPSRLGVERNVLRHRPVPVTIRLGTDGSVADLVRTAAAGVCAGAPIAVTTAVDLPQPIGSALSGLGIDVRVETEQAWLLRAGELPSGRIRLLGADAAALARAAGGRPDLAVYANPVTSAGRVELLPFVHEQAVSITAHRFGTPHDLSQGAL